MRDKAKCRVCKARVDMWGRQLVCHACEVSIYRYRGMNKTEWDKASKAIETKRRRMNAATTGIDGVIAKRPVVR